MVFVFNYRYLHLPKFTHMNLFWNNDVHTPLIRSIHATLIESDVTDKSNS